MPGWTFAYWRLLIGWSRWTQIIAAASTSINLAAKAGHVCTEFRREKSHMGREVVKDIISGENSIWIKMELDPNNPRVTLLRKSQPKKTRHDCDVIGASCHLERRSATSAYFHVTTQCGTLEKYFSTRINMNSSIRKHDDIIDISENEYVSNISIQWDQLHIMSIFTMSRLLRRFSSRRWEGEKISNKSVCPMSFTKKLVEPIHCKNKF